MFVMLICACEIDLQFQIRLKMQDSPPAIAKAKKTLIRTFTHPFVFMA
jgi:hypothetical protein